MYYVLCIHNQFPGCYSFPSRFSCGIYSALPSKVPLLNKMWSPTSVFCMMPLTIFERSGVGCNRCQFLSGCLDKGCRKSRFLYAPVRGFAYFGYKCLKKRSLWCQLLVTAVSV